MSSNILPEAVCLQHDMGKTLRICIPHTIGVKLRIVSSFAILHVANKLLSLKLDDKLGYF